MALRTPNSTGETGTYNSAGSVTLPGTTALRGMRTFSAAATAGKIAAGDHLGVRVTKSADAEIWSVQMAEYATGSLTLIEEEDGYGTLSDGDAVDVFATATDLMHQSAGMSYSPPSQTGPDWWVIESAGTTWNSAEQCYEMTGSSYFCLSVVTTGANANWGTGLSPTLITLDMWVPPEAVNEWDYLWAAIGANPNGTCSSVEENNAGGEADTPNAWNTMIADFSTITNLTGLRVGEITSSLSYKFRNIRITPAP